MSVSDTIHSLSECSKHLSTLHKIGPTSDLSDIYKDLQSVLDKWSVNIKKQAKTSHDALEQYSRYETFDCISLKEIQSEKNFHT